MIEQFVKEVPAKSTVVKNCVKTHVNPCAMLKGESQQEHLVVDWELSLIHGHTLRKITN